MTNKENKALGEWREELKTEIEKLKKERLSEQIAIARTKLEILESMEQRIKGDVYGEKALQEAIKKFKQTLEEKQMQYGKLHLFNKIFNHLDDIV